MLLKWVNHDSTGHATAQCNASGVAYRYHQRADRCKLEYADFSAGENCKGSQPLGETVSAVDTDYPCCSSGFEHGQRYAHGTCTFLACLWMVAIIAYLTFPCSEQLQPNEHGIHVLSVTGPLGFLSIARFSRRSRASICDSSLRHERTHTVHLSRST